MFIREKSKNFGWSISPRNLENNWKSLSFGLLSEIPGDEKDNLMETV